MTTRALVALAGLAVAAVSGSFAGFDRSATKARLSVSRGPGVPGTPLVDLTLTGDVAGKVTGRTKLDSSQLAALRRVDRCREYSKNNNARC
jgi:hypothetical protein